MISVKTKRVATIFKNKELHNIFARIIGVDDIDPGIITDKFNRLVETLNTIFKILQNFSDSTLPLLFNSVPGTNMDNELEEFLHTVQLDINNWGLQSFKKKYITKLGKVNEANTEARRLLIQQLMESEYDPEELRGKYNEVINSNFFKSCMEISNIICKYLKLEKTANNKQKHDLEDPDNLSYDFIVNAGVPLWILPSCKLDFRQIFISSLSNDEVRSYTLQFVYKLFQHCKALIDIYCIPNVHASDYIYVIQNFIDTYEKEIDRCKEAFAKMRQYLSKFPENYPRYYKAYVLSNNPYIILESWIKDLLKIQSKSNSPMLRFQFQRILRNLTQKARSEIKPSKELNDILDIADSLNLENLEG